MQFSPTLFADLKHMQVCAGFFVSHCCSSTQASLVRWSSVRVDLWDGEAGVLKSPLKL